MRWSGGRKVESVVANLDGLLSAAEGKPCWLFVVGDNQPLHYRNPTYAEQVAQRTTSAPPASCSRFPGGGSARKT